MSKTTLQELTTNFNLDKFTDFFREKNRAFKPTPKEVPIDPGEKNFKLFKFGKKLGMVPFDDGEFIIVSFKTKYNLYQRSGKKEQYEVGKNVLKEQGFDAGIFIFYDNDGNFRFSLIYSNYLDKRRDWSSFRRFTYFVSPDLTNKTFLQRIGDGNFSSLEKIKDAFAVEPVTREFYEAIANWYFWAVQDCRFPKDAEEEDNGRKIAVLRLITRIIFIWFMRERNLVPKDLFNEQEVQSILKSIDPGESTYYQAILQNLFFATLNTEVSKRQFRNEVRGHKGYNPDFGNQYVFRYHSLFSNSEEMTNYFSDIPFLNGGLFECLDDGKKERYIDGFTRRSQYQPVVPNYLFFGTERELDLNQERGTKNKTYKVQGLLNTLSSFNFTIDENSPDDADIALDPELLGRVFENLLAEFNHKTSITTRKETGSYYTPREVVNYMVTESFKEYFRTHLSEVENIDQKLESLFSDDNDKRLFNTDESQKLVGLIEGVRIVDPAVGSGAFPMGVLNTMVFILSKVDPKNELWKQAQLKAAESIPDPRVIHDTKRQIEELFGTKNAGYGRKLYLIQKCIYGVDIQQIAVEVAKLRFFLSLLVDEEIDDTKPNRAIQPLPNLEFKIMQGNSLISEFLGVDFDKEPENKMFLDDEDILIKEYEQKKFKFQNEPDRYEKARLKEEIENLIMKILDTRLDNMKTDSYQQVEEIKSRYSIVSDKKHLDEIIAEKRKKLYKTNGLNLESVERQFREFTSKNRTRPFFPWKLYFAEVFREKQGFDIVIGNPPYVSALEAKKIIDPEIRDKFKERFISARGAYDLYVLFFEEGLHILKDNGILAYISPSKYLSAQYAIALRELILRYSLLELVDLSMFKTFESSNVSTLVTFIKKAKLKKPVRTIRLKSPNDFSEKQVFENKRTSLNMFPENLWGFLLDDNINLLTKIENQSVALVSIAEVNASSTAGEAGKYSDYIDKAKTSNSLKIINTGTISHIYNFWGKKKYKHQKTGILKPYLILDNVSSRRVEMYKSPKLIFSKLASSITASYDKNGEFASTNTNFVYNPSEGVTLEFLAAYLNSRLADFVYKQLFGGLNMFQAFQFQAPQLRSMLVPREVEDQKPFIDIVSEILDITGEEDYLENTDAQNSVREYEQQIDRLVYNIFGLTKEEIKIIENQTPLHK